MTIYHNHHIIPRHMGGTDEPDNLVRVTVEEHANLHKQLWEDLGYQEDYIAWKSLSGQITLDEASEMAWKNGCRKGGLAPKPPVSEETKEKIRQSKLGKNNPMYGTRWTEQKKNDVSIKMQGENNPFYGKKHNDDMKKYLSEQRILRYKNGSKEGRTGPHSDETKEKIRQANKKQFSDPIKKEKHRQAMIAWAQKRKEVQNG